MIDSNMTYAQEADLLERKAELAPYEVTSGIVHAEIRPTTPEGRTWEARVEVCDVCVYEITVSDSDSAYELADEFLSELLGETKLAWAKW
jgi:hypothetical protein